MNQSMKKPKEYLTKKNLQTHSKTDLLCFLSYLSVGDCLLENISTSLVGFLVFA